MLKLLSLSALASAAVLAAATFTPLSAASLTNNMSTGHLSAGRITGGRFGDVTVGSQYFRPDSTGNTSHHPNYKPETDQAGCHTKKNSIWRCYDR